MKLNVLSPTQWTKLLDPMQGLRADSPFVRNMAQGFLRCGNCEQRQSLTPNQVEQYFREGWPVCCPETLKGGTMSYYHDEAQLKKELSHAE